MRADLLLCARGFTESRNKAQQLIAAGALYANGRLVKKASTDLPTDSELSVVRLSESFVGRGALKLLGALSGFSVDPSGLRCLDIGASTGGFADRLLRRGAASVPAVDCGRGQLAESLRSDPRVTNLEGVNARYLTTDDVGCDFDLCVMDVSFISQTYVLPAIVPLLAAHGVILALIKPQFELDAASVSKGVVRGAALRHRALLRVYDALAPLGLAPVSFLRSPIEGGDGNIEYFGCYRRSDDVSAVFDRTGLRMLAQDK